MHVSHKTLTYLFTFPSFFKIGPQIEYQLMNASETAYGSEGRLEMIYMVDVEDESTHVTYSFCDNLVEDGYGVFSFCEKLGYMPLGLVRHRKSLSH